MRTERPAASARRLTRRVANIAQSALLGALCAIALLGAVVGATFAQWACAGILAAVGGIFAVEWVADP